MKTKVKYSGVVDKSTDCVNVPCPGTRSYANVYKYSWDYMNLLKYAIKFLCIHKLAEVPVKQRSKYIDTIREELKGNLAEEFMETIANEPHKASGGTWGELPLEDYQEAVNVAQKALEAFNSIPPLPLDEEISALRGQDYSSVDIVQTSPYSFILRINR